MYAIRSYYEITLQVTHVECAGTDTYVNLKAGDVKISARLHGRAVVNEDAPLTLAADMELV